MKRLYLKLGCTVCFIALLAFTSTAQKNRDNTKQKAEMAKIFFLEGNWEGSGWIMRQDRQKHYFEQSEKVVLTLDGTAILIEGLVYKNMIQFIMHWQLLILTLKRRNIISGPI